MADTVGFGGQNTTHPTTHLPHVRPSKPWFFRHKLGFSIIPPKETPRKHHTFFALLVFVLGLQPQASAVFPPQKSGWPEVFFFIGDRVCRIGDRVCDPMSGEVARWSCHGGNQTTWLKITD
jgi:hypothetical protein